MSLVKFKRILRQIDEPTISISPGRFNYNVPMAKMAELQKYKQVLYLVDEEERKIAFQFLEERDDDSYTLIVSKSTKGIRSSANEIINSYPWLKKIEQSKDVAERSFAVKRDGALWSIKLRPSFEERIKREDKSQLKDNIKGIYRYLDDRGEIVYIGKGNIKDRLSEPARKDWKFHFVEYSAVEKDEEQLEWENFWILKYKEEHSGRLPYYNNNSGVAKSQISKK